MLTHFRDEERLQLAHGFPDYPAHCAQHRKFIEKLSELKRGMLNEGATLSLTISTNTMLSDWLLNHISNMDRKVGEYILKQRTM